MSGWVVGSVTILVVVVLTIMFKVTQGLIERESLAKAEVTLNGTALRIDNLLHEVEVAANGTAWNIEHHLDNPDAMVGYSREIVRNNRNIVGCAIAFEPNFYPQRGELFYTYSYTAKGQGDSIVTHHNPMEIEPRVISGLPYMGHNRFFIPKQENTTCWVRPHAPTDTILSATIACCMPIHDKTGRVVGVLSTDVLVDWLSNTVLSTKPYPNSYCTMIGVQGTYIIHPNSTRLYHTMLKDVIKDIPDQRINEIAKNMLEGERGVGEVNMYGEDSYIFYLPLNNGHWSLCIVCPKSDVFASNEKLKTQIIIIAAIGLIIIFVFCIMFITTQLRPLNMLARSTRRMTGGYFEQGIKHTSRKDEVGTLQNSFSIMQQSLTKHIKRISQLSDALKERNASLSAVYARTQEVNQAKDEVLHKIADKMVLPTKMIESTMEEIQEKFPNMTQEEITPLAETVMEHIETISHQVDIMNKRLQKKPS